VTGAGDCQQGAEKGSNTVGTNQEGQNWIGGRGAMGARRRGTGPLGAAWEDLGEVKGATGLLEEGERFYID